MKIRAHLNGMAKGALIAVVAFSMACSRDPNKLKRDYLASGENFMSQGKFDEASIQFRNAVRTDPKFVEAYEQLAEAYVGLRQGDQAYTALQQANELDPGRIDVHLEFGKLYLASGKLQEAEDEANFVIEKDANNAGAYELLGASYAGRHKEEQAEAAFAKLVQVKPGYSPGYVNLAMVELAMRREADAEKHMRDAIAADGHNLQAYTNLANTYRMKSDYKSAFAVLDEGIQKNSSGQDLFLTKADIQLSQHDQQGAEATLAELRDRQKNSSETAIALGDFYGSHNQYDRALGEYRRGLALSPKSTDLELRIVEACLNTGQVGDAVALNNEVLKKQPKDVTSRIQQGRIFLAQGKTDDAIAALRQPVADAPDSAQAHYFLGQAYWKSGSLKEAKVELEKSLGLDPGSRLALYSLDQLELQIGDREVALEYAKRAVQQDPNDAQSRVLLGTALLQSQQVKPAEDQFRAAVQLTPDDPSVHYNLGLALAGEKRWAEEEKELETALRLNPQFTEALSKMSDVWVAQNQREKAIARAKEYVAKYPDEGTGHAILGALLVDAKDSAGAEAELQRAVQLNPKLMQAYMQLGRLHQKQQQPDAAIEWYSKALALAPQSVPLETLLGTVYLEKSDVDDARKCFERALAIDPNFAVAAGDLAWVYARQGVNLDVALGLAEKAKQLMPDVDSISDTLAWVQYKKGIYASAVPLLQECVEHDPDSGLYQYHLGMALLANGDHNKGTAHLQAALRLKLPDADAQDARERLAQ